MYDVRNMLARNNAVGRGAYASTTGAGVAEELFDEDGFSYKELLQEYSGNQNKSSKRQSDNNRNRQKDNNHNQSLNLRPYSKRNTASASELLNGLALKNNAYIQTIGTAFSLSNTKLSSSESNVKNEDMSTNKVASEVDTLSPDSDVYFKDVTVMRSAPSEANRENWLAGYAGKATLVSTAEVDGVQWATIKTGSGKLAYVRADELSSTNPLVIATGSRDKRNLDIGTMLGVRNAVKLYKDTDEQSDYSGAYGDETGMEVLERTIKNGEEWLKVKTYSNDVGWCKAEQLCPLKEKLHTINNPSGDGYKLNLNVGTIPRSMIPSNLNIDADGNIECKISAAYLKNSINAHVFYDESGIAHGTRGAEAFDLSELDNIEIAGTAGFTPDGWVNFKLYDGRTITINMADLHPIQEGKSNQNMGGINDGDNLNKIDEARTDDYVGGENKEIYNADSAINTDSQVETNVNEQIINANDNLLYDVTVNGNLKVKNGDFYFSANKDIIVRNGMIYEIKNNGTNDDNYTINYADKNNRVKIDSDNGYISVASSAKLSNYHTNENNENNLYIRPVNNKSLDLYIASPDWPHRDMDRYNRGINVIEGSTNGDNVEFEHIKGGEYLYHARSGHRNLITIDDSENIFVDGSTGLSTIQIRKSDNIKIRGGGNNSIEIMDGGNVTLEGLGEQDGIRFYTMYDSYIDHLNLEKMKDGKIKISYDNRSAIIEEGYDDNARITLGDDTYTMSYTTTTIGELIKDRLGSIEVVKNNEQNDSKIKSFEQILQKNNSFEFEPNGKVSVDSGNGVAVDGFVNDGKYYVNDVSFIGDNGFATITNGNLLVEVTRTEYAEIEGTAKVNVKNRKMTINAEDNVKAKTIYENITVNTKGGNNEISVEGRSNTINTASGTNTITVKGGDAHINCGNGKDIISVTKSANTMISNFNPDVDKIKFNPNVELKVEKMGQSVVVKATDDKSNNFIASFLGFQSVDKIQAMVNEHNANLYYDELERELSEKIGNMFKKEVEPQYDAMKGMETIDQFIKGANNNVPKEVLNKYKEYIADCLIDTQVSTDDVTNIANLAPKLTKIFGSTEEIVVGDYIISPVSVSFAKNGTFTADVSKKGSKIATLYMDLTDNKSVANAMKIFIEAAQKTSESALNTAIKEYLTEVDGLLGTKIGKAYDVGKGVIDLLYGQEQEKTKFNQMIASFKEEKLRELISATFGNDTLKTIDSLKEAKNNIKAGINFSKADEWKSLTSMFANVEKMIAKLG